MYLLRIAICFLGIVALALPVLKLFGLIGWAWWVAFAPLWAFLIVLLVVGGGRWLLWWGRPQK